MQAEYSDVRFDGPPAGYNSTSYDKRYVAIHNTANDASDVAEADYAQVRSDHVSAHYYVDADSITQSLRTEYGANHAGSTIGNRHAIAYEITGTNAKTRTWWLANVAWPLLARQIARDCRKHAIAARLLTVTQMRDGVTTGIVTHDLMRQAWGGTTHTDPGPNFPMDYLIALVGAELDGDDMTPSDFLAILEDPKVAAKMRAFTWTYQDSGDKSAHDIVLGDLRKTVMAAAADALAAKDGVVALNAKVGAISAVDPAAVAAALAANSEFAAAVAAHIQVPSAADIADAVLDAEAARLAE